jgi:hypothetical protein
VVKGKAPSKSIPEIRFSKFAVIGDSRGGAARALPRHSRSRRALWSEMRPSRALAIVVCPVATRVASCPFPPRKSSVPKGLTISAGDKSGKPVVLIEKPGNVDKVSGCIPQLGVACTRTHASASAQARGRGEYP